MSFDHSIRSGQRLLRCGYTTGTCAALAAQGAVRLLLTGKQPRVLTLLTPKGWEVSVRPIECRMQEQAAICSVRKDAGDDSDVTDGLPVTATVSKTDVPGVTIDGGDGVGRVIKPGLDQPVGEVAINRVPRQMIRQQVKEVCRESGYTGGISVIISIEGGAEAARRTFNPQLGVEGGLSILGTSGIVEPMSEQAIVDTIALEIRQHAAESNRLILTPGNYGTDFLHAQGWDTFGVPVVKCSNFLGEALDCAAVEGIEQLLLVGHIGKLVKLAGGIMNTHSRYADCRTELFCAHTAICGADTATCQALMNAATTDACLEIVDQAHLRDRVLTSLLEAVQRHLEHRIGPGCRIGAVLFSNQFGLLGMTRPAKEILQQW
ncbi:cobalt-precorrin-5B (C(1))-methyltransferase CbiD [Subdoligranulum variabile]|uniref:cobalt-precorrin-5B (C(1))-methyltransferase CbiD n=1 Tax=Subdoligranulum variabile TaxID=214851 RepID=UPI0026ECC28F|nr:cobalt-precorrin-5B (C(1))-methyltransferase CbiD [Subdoligranulum variabile]